MHFSPDLSIHLAEETTLYGLPCHVSFQEVKCQVIYELGDPCESQDSAKLRDER